MADKIGKPPSGAQDPEEAIVPLLFGCEKEETAKLAFLLRAGRIPREDISPELRHAVMTLARLCSFADLKALSGGGV